MKKITVEVLKNINIYVIDKYYNEIYNLSNTHYEGTDKFLILQDILKHVSEIDKYVEVPIDTCDNCHYTDEIGGDCPKCGCTKIKRLRRVTGYLTGDYVTAFNKGKQAEVEDRTKHA